MGGAPRRRGGVRRGCGRLDPAARRRLALHRRRRGWTEQPDGSFFFTGDGGGWTEQPDGAFAFTGDAGGWVQESDGGWVYTGDGGGGCTNLQCQQGMCGDGGTATLTGHVWDPAGNNPLYKVVAYIPNAAPEPIADGINSTSCSCGSLYTGTPVATGITGADGVFTITNAPVGKNIPIVIQIGKWRNYFVIPSVSCGPNDLDTLAGMPKLTLPKTQGETAYSNIPNIAISTGGADTLECILARVGVAESEYTGDPNGTAGHIHIFQGAGGNDTASPAGPASSADGGLWDTDTDLNRYDIVMLSCEGGETTNPNSQSLADFVNAGGRVFASHYHYAFFFDDTPPGTNASQFPNVANWALAETDGRQGSDDYNQTIGATIQTTLASGAPFPEWEWRFKTWLGTTVKALGTGGRAERGSRDPERQWAVRRGRGPDERVHGLGRGRHDHHPRSACELAVLLLGHAVQRADKRRGGSRLLRPRRLQRPPRGGRVERLLKLERRPDRLLVPAGAVARRGRDRVHLVRSVVVRDANYGLARTPSGAAASASASPSAPLLPPPPSSASPSAACQVTRLPRDGESSRVLAAKAPRSSGVAQSRQASFTEGPLEASTPGDDVSMGSCGMRLLSETPLARGRPPAGRRRHTLRRSSPSSRGGRQIASSARRVDPPEARSS